MLRSEHYTLHKINTMKYKIELAACIFLFFFSTIIAASKLEPLILVPVIGENLSSMEKMNYRASLQQGLSNQSKLFSGHDIKNRLTKYAKKS